jgi:hypothetical protein
VPSKHDYAYYIPLNELVLVISGLVTEMSGLHLDAASYCYLPVQDVTYIPCLALADDEFLTIVQSEKPALAGNHAHFSNLVYIHQRISVNPPEHSVLHSLFDRLQVLRSQVTLFGSDDPRDVSFRLEGKHFVGVEEEEVFS